MNQDRLRLMNVENLSVQPGRLDGDGRTCFEQVFDRIGYNPARVPLL